LAVGLPAVPIAKGIDVLSFISLFAWLGDLPYWRRLSRPRNLYASFGRLRQSPISGLSARSAGVVSSSCRGHSEALPRLHRRRRSAVSFPGLKFCEKSDDV